MPEYLVELFVPRGAAAGVGEAATHAQKAAESLEAEGVRIRYVRSIYIPGDETCFHIYEASDLDSVQEAGRRAGGAVTRVVAAL